MVLKFGYIRIKTRHLSSTVPQRQNMRSSHLMNFFITKPPPVRVQSPPAQDSVQKGGRPLPSSKFYAPAVMKE